MLAGDELLRDPASLSEHLSSLLLKKSPRRAGIVRITVVRHVLEVARSTLRGGKPGFGST